MLTSLPVAVGQVLVCCMCSSRGFD